MTSLVRGLVVVGIIGFAVLAGWRVTGHMQAERFASADPVIALEWLPGQPVAMSALAQRKLDQGQDSAAVSAARLLLEQEPLAGKGYRVIGEVAEREGNSRQALALYRIASRRAPRDVRTNTWMVRFYLERGEYSRALNLVDRMMRVAPGRDKAFNPVVRQLAPLAQDEKFAAALVPVLQRSPPWRPAMMASLRAYPDASSQVMQGLQDRGGLSQAEYSSWLDGLISSGNWGEAYARWLSGQAMPKGPLPLLYNGDFSRMPSNTGFDWRLRQVPGVLAGFERVAGIPGMALRLHFLDQRVAKAGLEQPLLLFPGRYRLQTRMRADALRGEIGVQWTLACAGGAGEIARSAPIVGTFGWKASGMEFTVPEQKCLGLWLHLVNPVAGGAGQRLVGELWIADVAIRRL